MPEAFLKVPGGQGTWFHLKLTSPVAAPRGLVLLVHGMQEHSGRYGELAAFLAELGWVAATYDLRGHGEHRARDGVGGLGGGGWRGLLEDLAAAASALRSRHPGLPLILLGHSFGSFLAQAYAQRHGDGLAGLVLSGSSGFQPALGAGRLLARFWAGLRGGQRPAGLLQYLAVGHFDGPPWVSPSKGWVTSDPQRRKAYLEDPLCGGTFPNLFFVELLELLTRIWEGAGERGLPQGLPVLMLAGGRDPVGHFGKGPRALARRYEARDLPVTLRLYPEARHEVFNEVNRAQVLADLAAWLEELLGDSRGKQAPEKGP
jgi:alpha-beta hydrolase superfamily lysophospholipase